jgi:hypothetical protein
MTSSSTSAEQISNLAVPHVSTKTKPKTIAPKPSSRSNQKLRLKPSSHSKKSFAARGRSLWKPVEQQKKATKNTRLLVAQMCITRLFDFCENAGLGGDMRDDLEELMFSNNFRSRTGVRFLPNVTACGAAQLGWFVQDGTVTDE